MITITMPEWLAWVVLLWMVVSVIMSGAVLHYDREIRSLDRDVKMYLIKISGLLRELADLKSASDESR